MFKMRKIRSNYGFEKRIIRLSRERRKTIYQSFERFDVKLVPKLSLGFSTIKRPNVTTIPSIDLRLISKLKSLPSTSAYLSIGEYPIGESPRATILPSAKKKINLKRVEEDRKWTTCL